VNKVFLLKNRLGWKVNGHSFICFDLKPDRTHFSHIGKGMFSGSFRWILKRTGWSAQVGMATAAALFKLDANVEREVTISIPIIKDVPVKPAGESKSAVSKWDENLMGLCQVNLPDKHFQFLYDAAIRSLILHSPEQDVYPGPIPISVFGFGTLPLILNAMLCAGLG